MKHIITIYIYVLINFSVMSLFCADNKYEITVKCHENLQKINRDYESVMTYFKGVFKGTAELNITDHMPSQILAHLQIKKSGVDTLIKQNFMPATRYIAIVSRYNAEFDTLFQKTLSEQDTQKIGTKVNPWLPIHNLFNQKLKDVIIELKTILVQIDVAMIYYAKFGIFPKENTVMIDLDLQIKKL